MDLHRLVWVFEYTRPAKDMPYRRVVSGVGMFHGWSTQSYEVTTDVLGHEPVALIEMPDGTMCSPILSYMQFITMEL